MRVAVVGGAGFVGRHVVGRLAGRGDVVVTVDRRGPGAPFEGESVVQAELSAPGGAAAAAAACGRVEAVVWLAATIRRRAGVDETAAEDLAVMVEAPLRFLRALPADPSALAYLSSVQVYGRPVRLPVDEDHPTEPLTVYGVAKLCAEQYLAIACGARATAFAALRPAYIYGPGQHSGNVIPRFLEALRGGQPPVVHGPGDDLRDDVHVDDVARAVELSLDRRAQGVFNVASGRPHTLREVAEAACRVAGGGLRPRHVETPSGWIGRAFSVDRAREELGFLAAIPLEEGLAGMWLRSEAAP